MSRLRIAYVGAGDFTNGFMYPQLSRHNVELSAVCDLVEEKVRKAQAQYGFTKGYTDFRTMLNEVKPDAVFCVGGPRVHYAVGMEVLDRGIPLYVQKSPTPSVSTTKEMAELARKKGVVCHVGFNIRSSVAVDQSRKIMDGAAFGRPSLGIVRYGFVFGDTWEEAVMDQHCHAVDTARYLMGDIESLQAVLGSIPGQRQYVVSVKYQSGAVGTLNFTSEQGMQEFFYYEVTGEKGHMLISHQFSLLYRQALDQAADQLWEPSQWDGHDIMRWDGYEADVSNFLSAVRGEAPDRSPIESTIGTMEACEEIYRQLKAAGVDQVLSA